MKIVFLSYINRSGSSFLVNELSKLPAICVCPEADILYELFLTNPETNIRRRNIVKWSNLLEKNKKFLTWNLPIRSFLNKDAIGKTRFEIFIQLLLEFQQLYFKNCEVIVFKQNFLYKLQSGITDQSKHSFYFISLLRDPRATFFSQKTTISPQTGKPMCSNSLHFGNIWKSFNMEVEKFVFSPVKHKEIKFEELISNPAKRIDDILNFIEIDQNFTSNASIEGSYFSWLSEEYKKIHTNLNKSALPEKADEWSTSLSEIEISILNKYLYKNTNYSIQQSKAKFASSNHLLILILMMRMICTLFILNLRRMVFFLRYQL